MKIRLKRAWSQWSKGHVFPDMPGGQGRVLIARGIAEEVAEDGKQIESPMNRMAAAAPRMPARVKKSA